jgi:hypothetical protein
MSTFTDDTIFLRPFLRISLVIGIPFNVTPRGVITSVGGGIVGGV